MSTGYSWEGRRQVRATLLGARHVPERLCGGYVYLGRYIKCSTFFTFYQADVWHPVICQLCISQSLRTMVVDSFAQLFVAIWLFQLQG